MAFSELRVIRISTLEEEEEAAMLVLAQSLSTLVKGVKEVLEFSCRSAIEWASQLGGLF